MEKMEEKMAVCPMGFDRTTTHDHEKFHEIYSPEQLIEAQHIGFGFYGGRTVHAKGIIFEGTFTPDPQASRLTIARHLQKAPSNILVRFSNTTPLLNIPDNVKEANARGFAIKF